MNCTEVPGHNVTPATAAILNKTAAHVEHAVNPYTTTATAAAMINALSQYIAAHPDTPFDVLIADLERDITSQLKLDR